MQHDGSASRKDFLLAACARECGKVTNDDAANALDSVRRPLKSMRQRAWQKHDQESIRN